MSGGQQDTQTQDDPESDGNAGPPPVLRKGGLGVGLFWSILFMLTMLFSLIGGMTFWMVRVASADTID